jgi:uncharacterized protein
MKETALLLRFCWCAVAMMAMTHSGCASSASRKIGYGGETWSLEDIFADGPNRDLAAAAARGNQAGIDRALKAGADVNFRGAGGLTPLWWATWDQNLVGFTRLLERGADPNTLPEGDEFKSRSYQPEPVMLLIAQAFWNPKFLKVALAHGGNPNLSDQNGRRPLGAAMQQGTREHVDLLLAAGASVNQLPSDKGSAPIFAAVISGRFDYALMLLERGADPTAKARTGKDIAQLIGMFPYDPNSDHYVWRERVIRFLRSKGIEASPPPSERKRTKALPPDLR